MDELLTKESVEKQITEMWDVISNTPHHLRDEIFDAHVGHCMELEAQLRERYRKQEQIRNSASELLKACQWAKEQFLRLGEQGKYPEFMMKKNGGDGIMPLVKAINKAIK